MFVLGLPLGTDDYIEQIREAVLVHYANVALLLGRHCKQNIEETYKSLRRLVTVSNVSVLKQGTIDYCSL